MLPGTERGAIAFSLGVVLLGLDRLHGAQERLERNRVGARAVQGVTIRFIAIRMVLGVA